MIGHFLDATFQVLEFVRNAEVGELDFAIRVDHDIFGLDIAMHDAKIIPSIIERDRDRLANEEAIFFLDVLLALE